MAAASDIFLEYRLASVLLCLVWTIGREQPLTAKYTFPLDTLPEHRRILNAVANILVRNSEAVAVTAVTANPSLNGNILQIYITQQSSSSRIATHNAQRDSILEQKAEAGQSRWAEIKTSPWSYARKRFVSFFNPYFLFCDIHSRDDLLPLQDHLATLKQYLFDQSRNQEDSDAYDKQFESCSVYLISTCYPNVLRRFTSSLSRKLLSLLSAIKVPDLEARLEHGLFPEPLPQKANNVHLCRVIYSARSANPPYDFDAMVQEWRDKDDPEQSTPREASVLFATLSKTFEMVKSGAEDVSMLPILYTKATVVDVHYLILLILHKYREALHLFDNGLKKGNPENSRDLRVYSILLWRLARSSVLRSHLIFLRENMLISRDLRSASVSKDSGGSDEDGGETEIQEEMAAMENHQSHREDPALLIQRWILLLVSHLQSLHILSSLAASSASPGEIDLQLLCVKHSKFKKPQDWTAVLKRALTVKEGPLVHRYDALRNRILSEIRRVRQGRPGIFAAFKDQDIISEVGQVHAEAALVAAIESALVPGFDVSVRLSLSCSSLFII
jgi:hypothetical protein